MPLPPPYRPFGIRTLNRVGGGFRRLGWTWPSLDQQDLLDEAVRQLRRAYGHLGLDFDDETRDRMSAFLAANPRGSRGVHRYVREDFGLDLGEIRERLSDYYDEFDIPRTT